MMTAADADELKRDLERAGVYVQEVQPLVCGAA